MARRATSVDDVDVAVTRSGLRYGLRLLEPTHDLHLKVHRHDVISTGRGIGELDMMIAGHAMGLDAILVTNNTRHFGRLGPALTVENWVAQPAT